ncbi:MAG TPA: bifunctional diaminohydroxyphosphoribosylaminopyrimidine deaminase/5-amino-6-(5-phosphoribosylamino)uracil reductase RibD [Chthoniobacterales bacterium]|nr:bifunctional diaminohydroxyphosphoribosylaminopyrimidine deaminase/5-amino-6-(5-phosphoribosylamino)uracil reductase RibD [Chthoniobacterales bacterium]
MPLIEADARFMRAALREARKALGQTSPNPAVGAVLVIGDRIVSRGHHSRAGASHAEVECLRSFGKPIPRDAALYVTLEPCSTTGRTPACTTEIIKAGVKTVIIGAVDVNPRHSGQGIDILRRAGIEARVGVLADECAELNEAFNKWIVTGRPFVIAKCGMSLDGRLTRPPTESRWITSDAMRRHAHALRADVDAILVGAETVRRDNPRLTMRGLGRAKQQPLRIILTRSGNLPRKARVFTDRFAERTMVYRRKSLDSVLSDLGRKNVISVLIEGGGDVLGQALDEEMIDKMQIYLGPILTGGPVIAFPGPGKGATQEAARLERVRYEKIGQNLCITGYPRYRAIASTE